MGFKKKIIAISVGIIMVIVAIGCIGRVSKHFLKKEMDTKKVEQKKGIYYNALAPKEIGLKYDNMAMYGYSSLLYRNKVYTCEALNHKQYSEKEFREKFSKMIPLGTVYSNNGVYASTKSSKLNRVTEKGTLFRLEEYKQDHRVGIYYRHKKSDGAAFYVVEIYDCLNDFWVLRGEDIYQKLFRLRESECIEIASGYNEDGEKKILKKVTFQDKLFSDFYDEVCKGKFLKQDEEKREMDDFFLFTDKYGIQTELYVDSEGYVIYLSPEGTKFVIRIDSSVCEAILKMFQK